MGVATKRGTVGRAARGVQDRAASGREWAIKGVDGGILYEMRSKTRRGLVERIVADGGSLAGADLTSYDLSGLFLEGADFRGARLDGVDLRGAQASRARFDGCTMRPAKAHGGGLWPARLEGATLEGAVFDGADLTGAVATGARMKHSFLRAAVLDDAVLSGVSGGGMDFSHSRGRNVDFSDGRFVNALFSGAWLVEPDFRGADLSHKAFGGADPGRAQSMSVHLPDRTRGATVVAGRYDAGTGMAETVPAMLSDARASRLTRKALWCTTTLGIVAAGHGVEPLAAGLLGLGSHAAAAMGLAASGAFAAAAGGHGAASSVVGLVGVVGAVHFVKEAGGDWLREKASEALGAVVVRVRQIVKAVDRGLYRRADLVCAMARRGSADPLRMALSAREPEAARRGLWSKFRSFSGDFGQVILCDRRHLAMALATLSAHADNAIPMAEDVTVIRCDGKHASGAAGSPCAMRFSRSGKATAVWPSARGGHATVAYGRDGAASAAWDGDGREIPLSGIGALGLPAAAGLRLDAALALEAASLGDHGMSGFSYPRGGTHALRDGRDGSLLVQRRSDRRMDNPFPGQPALIRPDGSGVRMEGGSVKDDWSAQAAQAPRP